MSLPHLRTVLVAAMFSMAAGAGSAQAQALVQLGAGYVVNGPEQFTGGSVHALWDVAGGIGLYLDAKWGSSTLVDERTFTTDFDFQAARDEFRDDLIIEDFEWTTFNVALMRPITDEVSLYAGAGHSRRRAFGEFFDQAEERGVGGLYWVEDPQRRDARLNVLGGMFFQIAPRISVHLGAESAPAGVTVGGSFLFRSRQQALMGPGS